MRKAIAAVMMIAVLFAFASCSNNTEPPLEKAEAEKVAEALNPRAFISDVLEDGEKEGIEIEYRLEEIKAAAKLICEYALQQASA